MCNSLERSADVVSATQRCIGRRQFVGAAVSACAAALLGGCAATVDRAPAGVRPPAPTAPPEPAGPGRLQARPGLSPQASPPPAASAVQPLGLGDERDGLVYVPAGYRADQPAPLVLLFHGSNGRARGGLGLLQPLADAAGLLLLAPDARGRTWDLVLGQFGPDIAFIDRALAQVFARYAVDPDAVAVGGFSDGASYALSVGLTNGDLFGRVLAFAPGFVAPAERHGSPGVFIAHGTRDPVLPIDRCSRRIVPQLQRAGYRVRYREFDGPHVVPALIAEEAVRWLQSNVD